MCWTRMSRQSFRTSSSDPIHRRLMSRKPLLAVGCGLLAVTLPLSLSACAASEGSATEQQVSRLQAASGMADLVEPAAREYTVTDVVVEAPELLGEPSANAVGGSLTLTDRVITEATFNAEYEAGKSLTFNLTEPVMLRRDDDAASPVTAVGTLSLPGTEWYSARARVQADFSDPHQAFLTIEIEVPAGLLERVSHPNFADTVDTITAEVTLEAH